MTWYSLIGYNYNDCMPETIIEESSSKLLIEEAFRDVDKDDFDEFSVTLNDEKFV